MIELRWRQLRPVTLRWIGPSAALPPVVAPGVGPVAAIIGPRGPAGGEAFEHVQSSPSDEWVVNHNLGFRPSATVMSPGGVEVRAEVRHQSPNQLRVYFAQPQSGAVHCV